MASESRITRRGLRTIALGVLVVCALFWAAGSVIALVGVAQPAGACKAPYRAWALTWPLFSIGPQAYREWFVDWSFTLCR